MGAPTSPSRAHKSRRLSGTLGPKRLLPADPSWARVTSNSEAVAHLAVL
jgi:hypothetical protein